MSPPRAGGEPYVALLRGINVGGNNIIKMADLKACFEKQRFTNVTTYIQSGNVVFAAAEKDRDRLTSSIEAALTKTFDYRANVVVLSRKQLRSIVDGAPAGFGSAPDLYRYDVIFLKSPLTAAAAMKTISPKPGVDEAHGGAGALYFSRLIAKASQSRLSKIVSSPEYKNMTIRNWNTTTKLLALLAPPTTG